MPRHLVLKSVVCGLLCQCMLQSPSVGCGLLWQCAILSPNFRVRDFSIADVQPYPISLSWQGAMDEEGQVLASIVCPLFTHNMETDSNDV